MTKEKCLNRFFQALWERGGNENDLSDITYAMCLSSRAFSKSFLQYVFHDDSIKGDGVWSREYAEVVGSRPDFLYTEAGKNYLIENKIYDRNTHNEQYLEAFPHFERGFIANYQPEESEVSEYHGHHTTWGKLLSSLEKELLQTWEGIELELLEGYCSYLRSFADIREVSKMDFSNSLNSIYSYFLMADEVAKGLSINRWKNNDYLDWSNGQWLGKWYVSYEVKPPISYFFCLDMKSEQTKISVWVLDPSKNDKQTADALKALDNELFIVPGNYHKVWGVEFDMKEEIFKEYFQNPEKCVEEQKEIFSQFFSSVREAMKNQ